MQIVGLLGLFFDAEVVSITNSLLLFRLALAILWENSSWPRVSLTIPVSWNRWSKDIYEVNFSLILGKIFMKFWIDNFQACIIS